MRRAGLGAQARGFQESLEVLGAGPAALIPSVFTPADHNSQRYDTADTHEANPPEDATRASARCRGAIQFANANGSLFANANAKESLVVAWWKVMGDGLVDRRYEIQK